MSRTHVTIVFVVFCLGSIQAQWQQVGLDCRWVWELHTLGNAIIAATDWAVYQSADEGSTWDSLGSPGMHWISTLAVSHGVIIVGALWGCIGDPPCVTDQPAIARSVDTGRTWSTVLWNKSGVGRIHEHKEYLFSGFNGHLNRSSDAGMTWTHVQSDTVLGPSVSWDIWVLNSIGDILFVSNGSQLWQTADDGETWNSIPSGWGEATVWNLVKRDSIVFVGTSGGLYRSTTHGLTWEEFTAPDKRIVSLTLVGDHLFATWSDSAWKYNVFVTPITHPAWRNVSEGLALPTFEYIAVLLGNQQYLLAGTSSGIWRRPVAEMLTNAVDQEISPLKSFSLSQNYPNPFNPITDVRYSMSDVRYASLKVYDVLGREVATLVDEVKQPGEYTVRWDASGIPTGVYFYKMTAGEFRDVKKMILIR